VGVEQVGDGGGNVHATEGVEEGVCGILPHPSADEGVGGVVVVGAEVGSGNGRAVKVNVDAVIGNSIAQTSIRDQFDARWWHG
jgi:hypothetical protein